MAAGKEIRGKIKSVENTKKITKAMEMVAASKMRKAQERMRAARPYSEKIRNIAANLGLANPEYVHPFMKVNESKAAGIATAVDRGFDIANPAMTNLFFHTRIERVVDKTVCVKCSEVSDSHVFGQSLATRRNS